MLSRAHEIIFFSLHVPSRAPWYWNVWSCVWSVLHAKSSLLITFAQKMMCLCCLLVEDDPDEWDDDVCIYSCAFRDSFSTVYILSLVTLAASSGKRNVTVWRPSVCLSHLFLALIGTARDAARVHFGPTIRRADILASFANSVLWFNPIKVQDVWQTMMIILGRV